MTLLSLKKNIMRAITSSLASLVLVALKTLGLFKKTLVQTSKAFYNWTTLD
jgi:hypothetical protein